MEAMAEMAFFFAGPDEHIELNWISPNLPKAFCRVFRGGSTLPGMIGHSVRSVAGSDCCTGVIKNSHAGDRR